MPFFRIYVLGRPTLLLFFSFSAKGSQSFLSSPASSREWADCAKRLNERYLLPLLSNHSDHLLFQRFSPVLFSLSLFDSIFSFHFEQYIYIYQVARLLVRSKSVINRRDFRSVCNQLLSLVLRSFSTRDFDIIFHALHLNSSNGNNTCIYRIQFYD